MARTTIIYSCSHKLLCLPKQNLILGEEEEKEKWKRAYMQPPEDTTLNAEEDNTLNAK